MRNKSFGPALLLLAAACSSGGEDSQEYDETTLQRFKAALPSEGRVAASVPEAGNDPNALTQEGSAELAVLAAESASSINEPAVAMVRVLREITSVPPTLFDSEEREFLWGPWENEDGVGNVAVYIRENPAGDDFEYSYAFVRLVENDIASSVPVIWGAATPDPSDSDKGAGVTLWDLEANNAFEESNDPDFDAAAQRERGRFVMLYGHSADAEGEAYFNVAVFRNFLPDDAAQGDAPIDVDYFYGRFMASAGPTVDFIDWQFAADLCDAGSESCFENDMVDDAAEDFAMRAAFVNEGFGRAEAEIGNGDLAATITVAECWNDRHDRTRMSVTEGDATSDDGGSCTAPFEQTLGELGIPTLGDVDAELMAALDCVAENGIEACE